MKKSLLDLEKYRFYSSSILIIYEGLLLGEKSASTDFSDTENSMDCMEMEDFRPDDCESGKYRKVEVPSYLVKMKMIDFANVSSPTLDSDQVMHEGSDRGFMMGLDNLFEILESLVDENVFN